MRREVKRLGAVQCILCSCREKPTQQPHQEVLVDFEIAIELGQIGSAMQWGETFLIALIDLRAIVKQVMELEERAMVCDQMLSLIHHKHK